MKTLHILNGDATAYPFMNAGLPGDVVVWREMLSEGPLLPSPQPDNGLWKLRQNWLADQFGNRLEEEDDYNKKVVAEFDRIRRCAEYDEVILWFEHDLFCQMNLIFLLAFFARVDLGKTVLKQVSINQFAGVAKFKGLGQLTGTQLAMLYPQAESLTTYELRVASRVWPAYAASDVAALTSLLNENFGRLRFLRAALSAHLARLQEENSGLPLIENQLLTLIREAPRTTRQVIGEWLSNDFIYGLGDWSIENYLTQLIQKKVIQERDGLLVEVTS